MYLFGLFDHEVNYERAREYFELAHATEPGRATALLGSLYEDGLGVPQSNETAVEYYKIANEHVSKTNKLNYFQFIIKNKREMHTEHII